MSQITWRNINNPSFTGGNNLREQGGDRLVQGINSLAGLVGNAETSQRTEQTDAALGQIDQLDRSALATALQGNEFQNLGNVDQTAINKRLRGRDKAIDTEMDAKYSRDELLQKRGEQPTLGAIELAMSTGDFEQAATIAETLSDKSRAKVNLGITQSVRKARDTKDADTKRTANITNMEQAQASQSMIQAALAQPIPDGVSEEQWINDQMSNINATTGNDISEGNKVRSLITEALQGRSALNADSQIELKGLQQDSDDTIDAAIAVEARQLKALEVAMPTDKKLSPNEERKALVGLMNKASDLIPDGSWLSTGETGGKELKEYIQDKSNSNIPTGIIELALVTNAQTEAESWGNPVVWKDAMDKTIKELMTDKGRTDALENIANKRSALSGKRDNLGKAKRSESKRIRKEFTASKFRPKLGDIFK